MSKFTKIFKQKKPVIAMVHFDALPGAPLYDSEAGVEGVLTGCRKDLKALQDAGVDAVMDRLKTDLVDLMMIAGLSGHENRVRQAISKRLTALGIASTSDRT